MHTALRHRLVVVFASACLVVVGTQASAQTPAPIGAAPAVAAQVEQLGFISGPWQGALGDRTIEQYWSAPLGNSMVAMYRNVQNGQARLYELLVIEAEGDSVALRIKHFAPGPGLVGRQEKDAAISHKLVRIGKDTAEFEGTGENPNRVIFTRTSPTALTIRVERMRDGALTGTDFNYVTVSGPKS